MPRTHPPTPTPATTTKPAKAKSADATPVPDIKPAARVRRRARLELSRPTTTPAAKPGASRPAAAHKSEEPTKVPSKAKSVARSSVPARKKRTGLSALDAAAQLLEGLKGSEAQEGIQTADLIGRMERARLWTSPGGKTPASTLYAAMTREITVKKGEARFVRVSPGHFAFKAIGKPSRRGNTQ